MSYIYLVTSQEYFKIGIANDPASRLAQLQTGNPVELEIFSCWEFEDAGAVERVVHQAFKKSRHFLEWFKLSHDEVEKFYDICKVLGGREAVEYLGQASNAQIEEAEEIAELPEGGKWDYAAMFADGWRIEPSSSRGKNGIYWAWRKTENGKRPYIYGGRVSDLPYSMDEMRKRFET